MFTVDTVSVDRTVESFTLDTLTCKGYRCRGLFDKSDKVAILDGIEHLDTADSIVDHPRVVVPEHIRRWLRDIFDNAHLRG